MTDLGIAEMARCCSHLIDINLQGCDKICEFGDKALVELGKWCHELKILNLNGCLHVKDSGIYALCMGCKLTHIKLSGCIELKGPSVRSIAEGSREHLIFLDISGWKKLKGKDLAVLAAYCPKLMELNLKGCILLQDHGIEQLVRVSTVIIVTIHIIHTSM